MVVKNRIISTVLNWMRSLKAIGFVLNAARKQMTDVLFARMEVICLYVMDAMVHTILSALA